MALADGCEIVREWLATSGTTLYTLCATRISTPVAPNGFSNTQAAIIFHQEAGRGESDPNVSDDVYVFKCYGGSAQYSDARNVFRKLYDRLHTKSGDTASDGGIVDAYCVAQTMAGPEPDTGWPVHISKFRIRIR